MEHIIKTNISDVLINDHLNVKSPEYQKIKLHYERKRSLGYRLETLRHFFRLLYARSWTDNTPQHEELEDLLDALLIEYDYNIEELIDRCRKIVSQTPIDTTCKCGYVVMWLCGDILYVWSA